MTPLEFSRNEVVRLLMSLLQNELARLRPGRTVPPAQEWSEDVDISGPLLGINSAERMQLANAVSEVFHLYETFSEDRLLRDDELSAWVGTILESRRAFSTRFSVRSSGFGGSPKLCIHEWAALVQEVKEWAMLFEGRKRIVSFVPSHEMYGLLFTVLLPNAMGVPVVDTLFEEAPPFAPGDLVVSVPDHLRLFSSSARPFPRDVWALSSTAALSPTIATRLRSQGLESLVEVYVCSEAGGIAYRYRSSEPFEALPFYQADEEGDLIRRLPDARRRAVESPDHLRWVDARSFHLEGRKDHAVRLCGVNVYPRDIAQRIGAHPYLDEVHVRLSEINGAPRLKALFVFLNSDLDTLPARKELLLWMRRQLRPEELPGSVTFSSSAPPRHQGKVLDWQEEDWQSDDQEAPMGPV